MARAEPDRDVALLQELGRPFPEPAPSAAALERAVPEDVAVPASQALGPIGWASRGAVAPSAGERAGEQREQDRPRHGTDERRGPVGPALALDGEEGRAPSDEGAVRRGLDGGDGD
ncbi:hypothetical protein BV511_16135 [Methylorubrum extorquens]|nr:hypothetical protein BV511_16135 [Methylorubrum extorquens]